MQLFSLTLQTCCQPADTCQLLQGIDNQGTAGHQQAAYIVYRDVHCKISQRIV